MEVDMSIEDMKDQVVKMAKGRKATLAIIQDWSPESPRSWDNMGTMVCFDKDFDLGDKDHDFSRSSADGDEDEEWDVTEERFRQEAKDHCKVCEHCHYCLEGYGLDKNCTEIVRRMIGECSGRRVSQELATILPLYLYSPSNSQCSISLSGHGKQVGFILVTKDKVRHEFSKKRVSKKLMKRVEEILKGEVEVYNQYLEGDTYGYVLEKPNGDDIDSCWGFYGSDPDTNGIGDNLGKEYRHLIKKLEYVH
jgi:hypothetical protein